MRKNRFPFWFTVCLLVLISLVSADTTPAKHKQGEISPSSIDVQKRDAGISFSYVFDGDNNFASIQWNTANKDRFSLNAIVVSNFTDQAKNYVGGMLTYRLIDIGQTSASIGIGVKGLNVNDWTFEKNRQLIFGIQFTVPVKFGG